VGDPNSAPRSARVEPGPRAGGRLQLAGIPRNTRRTRIGRQRCRKVDFTVGKPDLRDRPHGRHLGSATREKNDWRAHPARVARMTLERRKPGGSPWDAAPLARVESSSHAGEPRGSTARARERHESSGIVSQGTCLHVLLSCRNPEGRSRCCGDGLFNPSTPRSLRSSTGCRSGRRCEGLGKGPRHPAPGAGFGWRWRSSS
jgi:hypothetical protein